MIYTMSVQSDHFGTKWCEDSNNRCQFCQVTAYSNRCILFDEKLETKSGFCRPCKSCLLKAKEEMDHQLAWLEQEKKKIKYGELL